jgi:hypothetical protein
MATGRCWRLLPANPPAQLQPRLQQATHSAGAAGERGVQVFRRQPYVSRVSCLGCCGGAPRLLPGWVAVLPVVV